MNIFNISSLGDIDFDVYHRALLDDGLFVLRGYDMSREEQLEMMKSIGDTMRWFPNHNYSEYFSYEENHSSTIAMRNNEPKRKTILRSGENEILIAWHMEHIGFPNPAVGASWNMRTFSCSNSFGRTLFVDGTKLFKMLSEDDISFLEKCLFIEKIEDDKVLRQKIICPIREHFQTGKKMVYISPNWEAGIGDKLVYAQTHQPTNDERNRFSELITKLINEITSDLSLRIEHRWMQHDVLVADLSRMYHAVTGGFMPHERSFYGIWAHGVEGDKYSGM